MGARPFHLLKILLRMNNKVKVGTIKCFIMEADF